MRISLLEINNLRVIRKLRIEPVAGVNWIVGGNGAGKTSLLEAIFLLARGRSFRSSRHGNLLRDGETGLSVKGTIIGDGKRGTIEMVASTGGRKRLLENGAPVRRVLDLKERIQVRILTENSQILLEGEPAIRRMFLDWNLFHVEHRYTDLYSSFRRVLGQRNAWLRSGALGSPVWDAEYIALSEKITSFRRRYVDLLSAEISSLNSRVPSQFKLEISLLAGWPEKQSCADAIKDGFLEDQRRGFTKYGPAKADLRVSVSGNARVGSRGQSKVAACLLQYAAQKVLEKREAHRSCIWLLDDLRAELDVLATENLWDLFLETQQQIFLTGRGRNSVLSAVGDGNRIPVFHVEHGDLVH